MLTTLEQEYLRLIGRARELPRVTYAGGQAGDGTGGAGGAGPIGIDPEGHVTTGNTSGTVTLADGSIVETTIRADGSKHIVKTDYIKGFIYTYDIDSANIEKYSVSYLDGTLKSRLEIRDHGDGKLYRYFNYSLQTGYDEGYIDGVLVFRINYSLDIMEKIEYIDERTIERTTEIKSSTGKSTFYEYRTTNDDFRVGEWYSHSIDRLTSTREGTVETRETTSTAILQRAALL